MKSSISITAEGYLDKCCTMTPSEVQNYLKMICTTDLRIMASLLMQKNQEDWLLESIFIEINERKN